MQKKYLLLSIIGVLVVECSIIVFIGLDIYRKYRGNLSASITPLPKESIMFNAQSELKYFYEFKPEHYRESKYIFVPPWLPSAPRYTINKDGLHDRFDYAIPKPSNTFRIVTLGDSWTFGLFTNTEDNYSEQLEDMLNQRLKCQKPKLFEVINFGVPGYDMEYALERFKIRGITYDPDLILWLIRKEDVEEVNELIKELENFYLDQIERNGERPNFVLREEGIVHDPKVESLYSLEQNKHIKAKLMALEELQKRYPKEEVLRYAQRVLQSINDFYKDTLVIFTIIPHFGGVGEAFKPLLKNFVRSRSHTYFHEIFRDLRRDEGLLPDMHANKKGHHLVAEDLFTYLSSNNIIPCQ